MLVYRVLEWLEWRGGGNARGKSARIGGGWDRERGGKRWRTGGAAAASSSEKRKERLFRHRPGFLVHRCTHVRTHTRASLPAAATLNLNLQTRSLFLSSLSFPRTEETSVKIDAAFVISSSVEPAGL